MKMFPDHDEYANMPQQVMRKKVGRAGSVAGAESFSIPDDTMAAADDIVAYSRKQVRRHLTDQK